MGAARRQTPLQESAPAPPSETAHLMAKLFAPPQRKIASVWLARRRLQIEMSMIIGRAGSPRLAASSASAFRACSMASFT